MGTSPKLADFTIGSEFSRAYGPVTRPMIKEFGNAAEDRNMIHFNDDIAAKFGLKNVIGHGLMNFSNLVRILDEWVKEDGRIIEAGCEYRGMYRPGDTIITKWTVTNIAGSVVEFAVVQKSKTPLYLEKDGEKVKNFEGHEQGWVSDKDQEHKLIQSEDTPEGTLFFRFRTATKGTAKIEFHG